jgi:hypothetical protein
MLLAVLRHKMLRELVSGEAKPNFNSIAGMTLQFRSKIEIQRLRNFWAFSWLHFWI